MMPGEFTEFAEAVIRVLPAARPVATPALETKFATDVLRDDHVAVDVMSATVASE